MSLTDGQAVDAANTNAAFVSKTTNSDIISIPSLKNNDVGSGAHVLNPQKAINKCFDTDGITDEDDANAKNYSSNNFIADGDSRKTAIEKLDAQLATAGGGEGISSDSLIEITLLDSSTLVFSKFEILYNAQFSVGGTAAIDTLKE